MNTCKNLINAKHTLIIGDSRFMDEISTSSIHLIVTSPPYWQLKDYGKENQIGFNQTYEDYINHLSLVWNECYRVLEQGCRLCINIGDQFARSVYYGRYKIIPIHAEIIKSCEAIGFDYMGSIIWQKPTSMNTTGGATIMGSYPYPRNGLIKFDYEFILIFKKPGQSAAPPRELKEISQLSKEEWNSYFIGHWSFNGERQQNHLAMFPLELPYRLIKMFSYVGDTVLDPFVGSGTTMLAAKLLHRNSIGYEINPEFIPVVKEKLKVNELNLWEESQFEILFQNNKKENWENEINKLPYIFKDKTKFDKKIDPKKIKFGSKIEIADLHKNTRHNFFSIKSILSPEEMILDNDIKIKLIGIKTKPQFHKEAINFLQRKINKHKVYLKFDKIQYDEKNNLLVYLYLKNKTFVNAHLIKSGLVDIDAESDYALKEKFLKLKQQTIWQKIGF